MPIYTVGYTYIDAYGRRKSTSVKMDKIDHPTAVTAAAALRASLQAISECAIIRQSVSLVEEIVASPASGANVDAGLTSSFDLGAFKIGTHKVPAPVAAILKTDGTADLTNALVLAYEADMVSHALISDGEACLDLLKATLDK